VLIEKLNKTCDSNLERR